MLNDILTKIGEFLGRIKLVLALVALVGVFFSGTLLYVATLLLVAEILLPYAKGLISDIAKFAIK